VIEYDSDIRERMQKLQTAFKEGAGGRTLKRELSKELRKIMKPTEQEMKTRVLRLPSKGHSGPSMRQAIARQTKAATRWSGKSIGVSIVQRSRGMPRDFAMAGRAFNRQEGWNPTTLGGVTVHQEMNPTQWFDGATTGIKPEIQRQVLAALDRTADTIGRIAAS
jgi:hypothetical protein